MSALQSFSAKLPQDNRREGSLGLSSNTGQKLTVQAKQAGLSKALIDFLGVTFPKHAARMITDAGQGEQARQTLHEYVELPMLIHWMFGFDDRVKVGTAQDVCWQFYPRSGFVTDDEGQSLGRYGVKDDGDFHVSLSGAGCARVDTWKRVSKFIEVTGAKITHVDIAVDDLVGNIFTFQDMLNHFKNGDFAEGGRPPDGQLIDDLGSNKGRSLTIGTRGHKQVQIYEKGKQLGDPESKRIRVEVRLYAKHVVIRPDVLVNPEPYFRGSYSLLVTYMDGVLERFDVLRATAEETAKAMIAFLERQGGRSLGLLFDAIGSEGIAAFIENRLARDGRPGRFKAFHGDRETLVAFVRDELTKEPSHD